MANYYDKNFFESYSSVSGESYANEEVWGAHFEAVADRIVEEFAPKTLLDAGCASGYLVAALRRRGVGAYGIDISEYAIGTAPQDIRPWLNVQSLTDPLPAAFPKHYDLVVCIEVLEHLLPEDGDRAIGLLCSYGDAILFSSTPDDLVNKTHVNVQQSEYWVRLFAKRGFYRDPIQSTDFVAAWAMYFHKTDDVPDVVFRYELNGRVERMRAERGKEREGTVYFDLGNGYGEDAKAVFSYAGAEPKTGRIAVPAGCRSIRIDPLEGEFATVAQVTAVTNRGLEKEIASNAALAQNGYFYFDHADPQFYLNGLEGVCWLEFHARLAACGENRDFGAVGDLIGNVRRLAQQAETLQRSLNEAEATLEAVRKADQERIDHLELHYNAAIAQREALRAEVAQRKLAYDTIAHSASWKITKPVRLVLDLVKKILKKITPPPIKKFFKCWKENGFRYTMRKVGDKIRHRQDYSAARRPLYTAAELEEQKKVKFDRSVKFSILVPLYNTPEEFLKEMIRSVLDQTYSNWELCLADGSDANHKSVGHICRKYASEDARVVYRKLEKNGGISVNTNACIEMATGDYIALFDHDDLLHPAALYEVACAIRDRGADFIYTDENTFHKAPKDAYCPHFKPDYAPDTLRTNNYICHFSVFAKELLDQVGGFRPECDGSQDYDMVLRLTEKAKRVVHIPKILYYWRAHAASVASDVSAKPYVIEAAHKALSDHLARVGLEGTVENTVVPSMYRIRYTIHGEPLVSVIIANKDHTDDLKKCLVSIREKTSYRNYEIVIVENNSVEPATFAFYEEARRTYGAKVVTWSGDGRFNYSAINNLGVRESAGEYVILLNNDTEIISEDWIQEMLMFAQREDVGAVGAKLYYPDDTVQHAGIGLGLLSLAGHYFRGFPRNHPGYMGRLIYAHNVSAVTAACVMVPRRVWDRVGGLDETFEVAFNDVDLCMRIRKEGLLIVFTPFAELYHYESKSRGSDTAPEKRARFEGEVERFQARWKKELEAGDPYYNPNFSLEFEDFRLK